MSYYVWVFHDAVWCKGILADKSVQSLGRFLKKHFRNVHIVRLIRSTHVLLLPAKINDHADPVLISDDSNPPRLSSLYSRYTPEGNADLHQLDISRGSFLHSWREIESMGTVYVNLLEASWINSGEYDPESPWMDVDSFIDFVFKQCFSLRSRNIDKYLGSSSKVQPPTPCETFAPALSAAGVNFNDISNILDAVR